jgi:hypothetical protein
MVLFYDIIQIVHLPDGDGRAVLFVRAFDGGFIGVTAVHGDRLRDSVPADRLLQKPQRGLCIPMLGEQKVNGLAVLIYLPIPIAPLTLDLAVRLVRKLGGNTWEVLDARACPWEGREEAPP